MQQQAGTPIVDAHLDLAYNARLGYDLRLPLEELRASALGERMRAKRQTPTVTLPELVAGQVRLVFGTIFVLPHDAASDLVGPSYTTADEAYGLASEQNEYYDQLAADGLIQRVLRRADLAPYTASSADLSMPLGLVTLIENADAIRTPGEVNRWHERGVRVVGPAWGRTRYCGGTRAPGPLTPDGRALMNELDSVGMALDLSHMSDESFWEALRLFRGPIIASHANCRRFVPTDRHLSDDMIQAIINRDGVVGVVLFNRFLDPDWTPRDGKDAVTLDLLVQHIEHICEIAQDTRHVGIGSDLDGGFGMEGIPATLRSCADLGLIGNALLGRGWRADEVASVLGGSWLRWLEGALPS
jgi:membrane dipeptidase